MLCFCALSTTLCPLATLVRVVATCSDICHCNSITASWSLRSSDAHCLLAHHPHSLPLSTTKTTTQLPVAPRMCQRDIVGKHSYFCTTSVWGEPYIQAMKCTTVIHSYVHGSKEASLCSFIRTRLQGSFSVLIHMYVRTGVRSLLTFHSTYVT